VWRIRCDNCRFDKNPRDPSKPAGWLATSPNQANLNFNEEVIANGGSLPDSPPQTDAYLTDNFPGDICDPEPITIAVATGGNAGLQRSGRRVACTIVPTGPCGPNAIPFNTTCDMSRGNAIHSDELVGKPTNVSGLTRVLRCACPASTTDDMCKTSFGCRRDNVAIPSGSWMSTTIADMSTSDRITLSATSLVPSTHLALVGHPGATQPGTARSFAFHQDWAWEYWADFPLAAPHYTAAPDPIFDGVVWSWVKSYGASSPSITAPPTGSFKQQVVRQFTTRISVREEGHATEERRCFASKGLVGLRNVDVQFCPMCTAGGILTVEQGDPANTKFIRAGFGAVATSIDPVLRSELFNENLRVIMATDAKGYSGGAVRGAVIDVATRGIVDVLRTTADGLIVRVGSDAAGPFDPPGEPVVALSGKRQELAIFGERDASGQVGQQIRTFDFDLHAFTTNRLLGDIKFTDPVAVTYRAEDDSYYLLDRTHQHGHPTLSLLWLPRGLTLHKIAEWKRPPRFDNFALTSGADLSIVVSAWNQKKHAICVLSNQKDGLVVRGRFSGRGSMVVPAAADFDGITFLQRNEAFSP